MSASTTQKDPAGDQGNDGLVALTPGVGVHVARAVAVTRADGPAAGLRRLDELPPGRLADHQPYWVARADALRWLGDATAAGHATAVAVGLTEDPAVRQFLLAPERDGDATPHPARPAPYPGPGSGVESGPADGPNRPSRSLA